MKNKLIILFVLFSLTSFSQSISSSPYSLYGLGSVYESNFGAIAGAGSTGIATTSNKFLNNLNPASLAFMIKNHFLFEVGGSLIGSTYEDNSTKESRNNVQFSHIAFGFPVTAKSAFSVALLPYSSSSFKISNLKLDIEDSNESYTLNATGSGGLNKFDLSYGYMLSKKWALGLTASFLFGNTTDNRDYIVLNSVTSIDKSTSYGGVRPSLGTQFVADSTMTFGMNIKSPAKINASKDESVSIYNNSGTTTISSDELSDVDDYYMPLEIGVGFNKSFKDLTFSVDYEKSLWANTNQSELYGNYVNQDKYAFGVSYKNKKSSRNYWDNIQYSAGVKYDKGYLEVDGKRVNNALFSLGVSLPINDVFSAINIGYSYGQQGRITDGLIKENYHKVSVNLSLDGIWFVKRKID